MIKVLLQSKILGIAFSHPMMQVDGVSVRCTHCGVFELSEYDAAIVAEGVTFCSLKDNFCKATGRRIALTRALEKMRMKVPYMTKAERRKVWEAYLEPNGRARAR